jgi:hypothetical protein
MGRVYQVRHLEWGIDLAVKSPRARLFRTAADRQRFVAEAQTWVSLGPHAHVCGRHYVRTLEGIPRWCTMFSGAGGGVSSRPTHPGPRR